MTPKQFFEKFELLADAPDAVARMRELVLQLAVQGRLVSQSPDDESAAALAITISKDRAALVKARSLVRQRVFPSVAEDQYPFGLPSGWLWTRLGNLCRVQAGFAFKSAAFVQGVSGVPIIRIRDITKDHTQANYTGEYREEFLVEPGDYLVGMDGNFTVAKWRGPRALLNQRVSRLQWYSKHLEPSFIAVAAQHRLSELQGTKGYTTVDHLSSGQIENAVVPLPPLPEQKRIVAKVDELMALCDRLEGQQQERETRHGALARASLARFADAPTPANLQFLFHKSYDISPVELRRSILTLAVRGKLVPQDPKDEAAERFVRRLQLERKEAFDAKVKLARREGTRLPKAPRNGFVSHAKEGAAGLPNNWCETRVGDVSDCLDYLRVPVNKKERLAVQAAVPYYGANGQVGWIDKYLFDEDLVLVVEDETFIGRVKPFSYVVRGKSWVNNHAHVLRPLGGITADFLNLILCQYPFIPLTSGTTARRKLTQPSLMDAKLAFPPLAEQHRIVAKVDQLMALMDELEAQLAESRATATKLLEAVVAELTAQT